MADCDRAIATAEQPGFTTPSHRSPVTTSGRRLRWASPPHGLCAKAEHVTVQEIKKLWAGLSSGDWLVLYQHRWQRDQSWRDKTRNKFADACGTEYVRTFLGPKIAGDVALFAVKKLDSLPLGCCCSQGIVRSRPMRRIWLSGASRAAQVGSGPVTAGQQHSTGGLPEIVTSTEVGQV